MNLKVISKDGGIGQAFQIGESDFTLGDAVRRIVTQSEPLDLFLLGRDSNGDVVTDIREANTIEIQQVDPTAGNFTTINGAVGTEHEKYTAVRSPKAWTWTLNNGEGDVAGFNSGKNIKVYGLIDLMVGDAGNDDFNGTERAAQILLSQVDSVLYLSHFDASTPLSDVITLTTPIVTFSLSGRDFGE